MEFLIVLSYARSGSTVVQRVLNTSDDVFISGEKLNLISSLHSFVKNMEYVKHDLPKIFSNIDLNDDKNPMFNSNNINIDGLINDLVNTTIKNIIAPYENKTIIGWKENFISPVELGNDKALELLQFACKIFPNLKFIINIRDAQKTSESTVWKLKNNSFEEIRQCREWLINIHNSEILGKNKTCLIDHDKWSINFDEILNPIINFGFNINKNKSIKILKEQLNHLKDWQI